MGWTANDMKRKGLVANASGEFVHVSTLTDKAAKVKKLGNLLHKAGLESGNVSETGGTVYIKPLSANKSWVGKLRKTDEHRAYIDAVTLLLPKSINIPDGLLRAYYEFGFSSRGADVDNPLKTFVDCLAKKYGFNDNRVMDAHVKKVIVPKGKEYIKFSIQAL